MLAYTRYHFLLHLGKRRRGCDVLEALRRVCSKPIWLISDLPEALQQLEEAKLGTGVPPSCMSSNLWP